MERKEFFLKLSQLAEMFSKKLTPIQGDIYFGILGKYPRERINGAFRKAIENEEFFPTIATLKRYLGDNGNAMDLFRKIEETLRSGYGRNNYQEAREFMGEQAYAAIEMLGGWGAYCNMEPMKANQELMRCCAKVVNDSPEASPKEIEG